MDDECPHTAIITYASGRQAHYCKCMHLDTGAWALGALLARATTLGRLCAALLAQRSLGVLQI